MSSLLIILRLKSQHAIIYYLLSSCGWPIRTYPWGIVEPMASTHSDLLSLKQTLFELSPERLKATTEENFTKYRAEKLNYHGQQLASSKKTPR